MTVSGSGHHRLKDFNRLNEESHYGPTYAGLQDRLPPASGSPQTERESEGYLPAMPDERLPFDWGKVPGRPSGF